MKRFHVSTDWIYSLRFRSVWLVLFALIPGILVVIYSSMEQRREDSKAVQESQAQLASVVSTNYERQLSNAESALAPLSLLFGIVQDDIQSSAGPACDGFLETIRSNTPGYLNLLAATLDGEAVCSAQPVRVSYANDRFFQEAVQTKQFTVSVFKSNAEDRWIDLGLPITAASGKTLGILVATLDLRSFDSIASTLDLPEGSTVKVIDKNGTTLSVWPDPDAGAGQTDPSEAFEPAAIGGLVQGKETSADGEKYLYASSPLQSPTGDAVALVKLSVPESVAYSAANSALRRNVLLLFAAGAVTLVAAWWLGRRFLLRPVIDLLRMTQRFTAGDWDARNGPNYKRNLLGILSRQVDVMAETVQDQNAQIRRANQELERRVTERTVELSNVNKELSQTNDELRHSVEESRRLEQALLRRTSDLELANQELESFAYSVSHDLRAPLRAIDGFSQTLVRDYSDRLEERGVDRLNRVRAAAQRMGGLIDDLLSLSRTSRAPMDVQKIDLVPIARGIVDQLRDADPHRSVEFKVPESLPVKADPGQMKILLQNLLSNAWKFTSRREHANIEMGVTTEAGEEVFYVRDDGAGFDMEYADKLFGAFQRLHTENEFPGYGIGLATVQRIVRRHGGRVWAKSTVNEGAAFFFTLEHFVDIQLPEEAA